MKVTQYEVGRFIVVCFLCLVAALVLRFTSGCAAAGEALKVVAPYAPDALALATRFLEGRKVPPGECLGVPAQMTPDPGSAHVVCIPGKGWLDQAASTLRAVAVAEGETLDESRAICIHLPKPHNPERVLATVCRAPYEE